MKHVNSRSTTCIIYREDASQTAETAHNVIDCIMPVFKPQTFCLPLKIFMVLLGNVILMVNNLFKQGKRTLKKLYQFVNYVSSRFSIYNSFLIKRGYNKAVQLNSKICIANDKTIVRICLMMRFERTIFSPLCNLCCARNTFIIKYFILITSIYK